MVPSGKEELNEVSPDILQSDRNFPECNKDTKRGV